MSGKSITQAMLVVPAVFIHYSTERNPTLLFLHALFFRVPSQFPRLPGGHARLPSVHLYRGLARLHQDEPV